MNPIDPGLNHASALPREAVNPQVMKVAKQFEALFVNQMVEAMRKTVHKGGLVPQGQGERIYQAMLDQEHAGILAESGQIGLANVIYQHLMKNHVAR